MWNPINGQVLENLEGQNAWTEGVAFSNRGTTVGADQTVGLWSLTD